MDEGLQIQEETDDSAPASVGAVSIRLKKSRRIENSLSKTMAYEFSADGAISHENFRMQSHPETGGF